MGAVIGAASAVAVTAAGAAAALSAPFGAAGNGGQYLAGHVMLGLGLGHAIAILLRVATRRLMAGRTVSMAEEDTAAAPAHMATVTVLPARPPAMAPLRGRHAA
ncbi:hypothetical protein ACFVYC_13195 [Pseudarthrobacter sp. NPDC058329]|uniref:hypothetical protein n=1 Tax=Pseudarthrobacter sp. NPDC058329 TaxID=3346448 RepID=UPI0036DEF2B4